MVYLPMLQQKQTINTLFFGCYLGFLVCLVFAFRYESSVFAGLLLVTAFIKNKSTTGPLFNPGIMNGHFIVCALFFLLQVIALAYTGNVAAGWRQVQLKSALVVVPLSFYAGSFINPARFALLMKAYVGLLAMALTWCLGYSFVQYRFHQAPVNIFFYHQLLESIGHHAVQFSILVFAGLVYLLYTDSRENYVFNKPVHVTLLIYFIAGIVLLASKLVIGFMVVYLLLFGWRAAKRNTHFRFVPVIIGVVVVACCCLVLFTNNPVRFRFFDILHGNINIIEQPTFHKGVYFNGVQFRLLQWRFVFEIMQEHQAWVAGVSPGDAQLLLDQKYTATHMYTGTGEIANHGFLGYNTHNQFLEALLQTGLLGLLCFIAIVVALVKMALQQKSLVLSAVVLIIITYCFTEAILETQYGLLLFTFLPLFFYFGADKGEQALKG